MSTTKSYPDVKWKVLPDVIMVACERNRRAARQRRAFAIS